MTPRSRMGPNWGVEDWLFLVLEYIEIWLLKNYLLKSQFAKKDVNCDEVSSGKVDLSLFKC